MDPANSTTEHFRRLQDQVEEVNFQTDYLEGEIAGREEARAAFRLIQNRYLVNWKGYPEAGPQILFMGSEKQGKSTILMAIMRILFADPSFVWLQKLRRANIHAEYGKKLSYFKEDPCVYITTAEGSRSALEHEACQRLLDEPDDPPLVVELMPKDPLHRLLRAALLVEGAIATAWTASFHFDRRFAGDNERAEIRFRTRSEMKEYIDRVSEPHKRKLLLSDEQAERDRELLALFRLTNLPTETHVTRLGRGELKRMSSRDCHAEVFKHIQLLKDHKHLVREIRWFAAPAPELSGLNGITLIDSPGFKEEGDSNSEITVQALENNIFFNIIVEAPRFQGDFLNKILERTVAQPNIIDELLLSRFMLTLTKVENILDSPQEIESEAPALTVRKMILGRSSELGQKLAASAAIKSRCEIDVDGMLPTTFITGAVHDERLRRNKDWIEWKEPENLAHFDDIPVWKNQQAPDFPAVNMRQMAEDLAEGHSARFLCRTLHQHGPWIRKTFQRQVGADFASYVASVERILRSILPDPTMSLEKKWRNIVKIVLQESRKLMDQSSLEFSGAELDELPIHLDDARQAVRSHFDGLQIQLKDAESDDRVDYLELYFTLAARRPLLSKAIVAGFLADRFYTSSVRNWLTTGAPPSLRDVLAQVWDGHQELILHHVHRAIHSTFQKIVDADKTWREEGVESDEIQLCEVVAERLGLSDHGAAREWIDATSARLDKIGMTPQEKRNREHGKRIKEALGELKTVLEALAADTEKDESDVDAKVIRRFETLSADKKEELLELLRSFEEPGDNR